MELAFYGGTFTGLSKARMESLLGAAAPYLRDGMVKSIRISTRPDSLDEERLAILKAYGVATVELGAQSMNDRVLKLSQRGHTAEDTRKAVFMLKASGFKVGIQLMPGYRRFKGNILGYSQRNRGPQTPYDAAVSRPGHIGDGLARLYGKGSYRPLSLGDAVEICVTSVLMLEQSGIRLSESGS